MIIAYGMRTVQCGYGSGRRFGRHDYLLHQDYYHDSQVRQSEHGFCDRHCDYERRFEADFRARCRETGLFHPGQCNG